MSDWSFCQCETRAQESALYKADMSGLAMNVSSSSGLMVTTVYAVRQETQNPASPCLLCQKQLHLTVSVNAPMPH